MTILLASLALGALLSQVLPPVVAAGTKQTRFTEADFQAVLVKRGLA